jgi:hypothetical protein
MRARAVFWLLVPIGAVFASVAARFLSPIPIDHGAATTARIASGPVADGVMAADARPSSPSPLRFEFRIPSSPEHSLEGSATPAGTPVLAARISFARHAEPNPVSGAHRALSLHALHCLLTV